MVIPTVSSPAQVVAAYLVQQLGLSPYWELQQPADGSTICFVDMIPDEVDQLVTVRDVPGMQFGRRLRSGKTDSHQGIQIFIRALDFPTGYPIMNSVCNALDASGLGTIKTPDGVIHYIQSLYRVGCPIRNGEEVGKRRLSWIVRARISFQDREPNLA